MNFFRGNFINQVRDYFSLKAPNESVEKTGSEEEKVKLDESISTISAFNNDRSNSFFT